MGRESSMAMDRVTKSAVPSICGWAAWDSGIAGGQRNPTERHRKELHMKSMLMRLWKEEEGQDLIEYAMLVALIALVVAAAFPALATAIVGVYTSAETCMAGGACTT